MSNLQPNCCLKFDFQKVDQHAAQPSPVVSSHLISSYLILSYLILSYLILSYLIESIKTTFMENVSTRILEQMKNI